MKCLCSVAMLSLLLFSLLSCVFLFCLGGGGGGGEVGKGGGEGGNE